LVAFGNRLLWSGDLINKTNQYYLYHIPFLHLMKLYFTFIGIIMVFWILIVQLFRIESIIGLLISALFVSFAVNLILTGGASPMLIAFDWHVIKNLIVLLISSILMAVFYKYLLVDKLKKTV
jgi:hypothetical protein